MKKRLLVPIFLSVISSAFSQLYISPGEVLSTTGNAILSVREDSLKNNGSLFLNSGQIYVSGHLINAGTINAATSNITFDGSSVQKLMSNGATYYDLTLNNTGSGVELKDNASIDGQLDFLAGVLNTTVANVLTLNPSANVLGEANGKYVKGALETIQLVDGTAPVSFSGMGVTIDAAGQNLGNVSISRKAGLSQLNYSHFFGNASIGNKTIDRIWDIEAQNPPVTPVSLTLDWVSDDNNGINLASSQTIYHPTNGLTAWFGASLPFLNNTSLSTTINTTHFSKWSVGDNIDGALATVNLAFTAYLNDANQTILKWSTDKEMNCAYYIVERSLDNANFEFFSQVSGNGTTNIPHTYQDLDKNPALGFTYYRLKQVDIDGTFHYTEPVNVFLENDFVPIISVYPNPSNGNFNVQVSPNLIRKRLTITDAIGREITKMKIEEAAFDMNLEVASGVYFLNFSTNEGIVTKKIVIQ
jgi:hypothetical protein